MLSALLLAILTAAPASSPLDALSFFEGTWRCAGTFAKSGKSISSTEVFSPEIAGTALAKHHTDTPPWTYVALELWSYDGAAKHYRAVIEDNFGSVRQFSSPGWEGASLTWTAVAPATPQSFRYDKLDAHSYRVSYTARRDSADVLIDSLVCTREETAHPKR